MKQGSQLTNIILQLRGRERLLNNSLDHTARINRTYPTVAKEYNEILRRLRELSEGDPDLRSLNVNFNPFEELDTGEFGNYHLAVKLQTTIRGLISDLESISKSMPSNVHEGKVPHEHPKLLKKILNVAEAKLFGLFFQIALVFAGYLLFEFKHVGFVIVFFALWIIGLLLLWETNSNKWYKIVGIILGALVIFGLLYSNRHSIKNVSDSEKPELLATPNNGIGAQSAAISSERIRVELAFLDELYDSITNDMHPIFETAHHLRNDWPEEMLQTGKEPMKSKIKSFQERLNQEIKVLAPLLTKNFYLGDFAKNTHRESISMMVDLIHEGDTLNNRADALGEITRTNIQFLLPDRERFSSKVTKWGDWIENLKNMIQARKSQLLA